jgi:iron complex outermembrane recepter protein
MKKTKLLNNTSMAAIGAAMVMSPLFLGIAHAQSSENGNEAKTYDSIVVTAQKREQSIDDVGMSIAAASDDQLRNLGVRDVSDLAKLEPAFNFSRSIYGTPIYTLRGVGFNDVSLAAPPTVTVYTDQIPYSFSSLTKGASLDIERVEVLKGPQGTLFGQNATGGAINYIAAKPTKEFSAGVTASYGSYNAVDLDGFVSGSLSDTLRGRVAVGIKRGGAWQEAYTRTDSIGDRDFASARAILEWEPTDRFTATLNINGWRDLGETQVSQLVAYAPVNPEFNDQVPELFTTPPASRDPRAAEWDPGEDLSNDQTFFQASLRANYELTDNVTFSSITSYQDYQAMDRRDVDGIPAQTLIIEAEGDVESFFQELRLAGDFADGRLHWLVAASYSTDKSFEDVAFLVKDSPSTFSFVGATDVFTGETLGRYQSGGPRSIQDIETQAIYANLEYELTDSLSVLGGIRYTDNSNDYLGCAVARDPTLAAGLTFFQNFLRGGVGTIQVNDGDCFTIDETNTPGLHPNSLNEDNVSWRVGVNWKPVDGTLLYATTSQGYKAGSFPTIVATTTVQLQPVTQESLLAYEAGFKTWLFDNRLNLEGSVYFYDYTDKQLRGRIPTALFGPLEILLNVPTTEAKGVDLKGLWRATDALTINASANYIDTEVVGEFINFDAFGNLQNFEGEPFPFTPEWSFNAGFEYRAKISQNLVGVLGANVNYRDDTVSAFGTKAAIADGNPSLEIDSYTLLDLRAGVEDPDGNWSFYAWGRNVTDEYYWTDALRNIDTVARNAGQGATFGATFDYNF